MEKQITDLRKFVVSRAKNASKEIVLENRMEMPILLTRPELNRNAHSIRCYLRKIVIVTIYN